MDLCTIWTFFFV